MFFLKFITFIAFIIPITSSAGIVTPDKKAPPVFKSGDSYLGKINRGSKKFLIQCVLNENIDLQELTTYLLDSNKVKQGIINRYTKCLELDDNQGCGINSLLSLKSKSLKTAKTIKREITSLDGDETEIIFNAPLYSSKINFNIHSKRGESIVLGKKLKVDTTYVNLELNKKNRNIEVLSAHIGDLEIDPEALSCDLIGKNNSKAFNNFIDTITSK